MGREKKKKKFLGLFSPKAGEEDYTTHYYVLQCGEADGGETTQRRGRGAKMTIAPPPFPNPFFRDTKRRTR